MPALLPLEQIDAGGVDSRSNPINMPRNRALRCLNWVPKQAGFWELRYGYSTVSMSTVSATAITGLFPYRIWDGHKYVLFVQGATLQLLDTATGTVTTPTVRGIAVGSSAKGNGYFANNRFHYGNGTDQKWFDATTWRDNGLRALVAPEIASVAVVEGVREFTPAQASAVTLTAAGGGSFPADSLTGHLMYVAIFDTGTNEVGPATISVGPGRIKVTLNQKITVGGLPSLAGVNVNWVKLIGGTADGANLAYFFTNTSTAIQAISVSGGILHVQSNGHGLSTGDVVIQSGTTNADSVWMVTVVDGNNYTVATAPTGLLTLGTTKRIVAAANAATSVDVLANTQDTTYQVNQDRGLPASTVGGPNAGYQLYASIYNPNGGGHVGNRVAIGPRALQTAYRSNWRISGLTLTNLVGNITTVAVTNVGNLVLISITLDRPIDPSLIGRTVNLAGLTTATFLNGAVVFGVGGSGNTITGQLHIQHANYGPAADTGTVTSSSSSTDSELAILIGRTGDGAQVPYVATDPAGNWMVMPNGTTAAVVTAAGLDGNHEMASRNGIIPPQCNMFCVAGDYVYAGDTGSPFLRRSGSLADDRAGIFTGRPEQSWAPDDIDTFPTGEAMAGMFEIDQEVFCGTLHDSALSVNLAGIQQWVGPWQVGIAGRRAGTKCGAHGFYWLSGDKAVCTFSGGVPIGISDEYELAELSQIGDVQLPNVELVYYRNIALNKDELRIEGQKSDGTPYTIIHDFKLLDYHAPGSVYGQGYSSQFSGSLATAFTSALIRDGNGKLQIYAGATTGQLYQLYTGSDDAGNGYTADAILLLSGGPNRPNIPWVDFYGDQNIKITVGRNLQTSLAAGAMFGFEPPSADADVPQAVQGAEFDFLYRQYLIPPEVQRLYLRFQLTSHTADGVLDLNSPPHIPLENYGRLYEFIPAVGDERDR